MFCEKCGKQIEDDSKFCLHCGATVTAAAPAAPATPVAAPAAPAGAGLKQKLAALMADKKKAGICIGIAAAVLVAIIAVIIVVSLPTVIYMDDYISVTYEGLSTRGYAYMEFDYESFIEDVCEAADISEKKLERIMDELSSEGMELELDIDEEKQGALANGDVIDILFECDNDLLKDYKLKFELKNETITLNGFEEPIFLDLFADIEVVFTGCSPYAEVELVNNSTNAFIQEYVYYYIDNSYNLEEGETFTIQASYSEYEATQQKYVITSESYKEMTATNLPQPKAINPFDYIEVTFSGMTGNAWLNWDIVTDDDNIRNYLYYELNFNFNQTSGLYEGQFVTLTYSTDSWSDDPLQYGLTLTGETSKKYTVTKLDKYMTSFEDLSAEGRTQIIDAVTAVAKNYLSADGDYDYRAQMYLYGTDSYSGNELIHASALTNLKLDSVIYGIYDGWYETPRLVFIYTLDIDNHPNITANNGDVTGACAFFYIIDPIVKGDGTLDVNFDNIIWDLSFDGNCYLSKAEMEEAALSSFVDRVVYNP